MDIVGKKVESQVQFWSLLGPFLVLLSIAVLLFKVSVHWYFPVSALIGIPLCVKWKMKGMAGALCSLLFLSGIGYQNLELDDRYWHVGLAMAMAFSFIVLTLSLEEVDGLVTKLQLESQSRLDNLALLDEKWKAAEQEWSLEKEQSKTEIAALTQEASRILDDKQTFYKLAQLSKEELIQVRGQHDHLLQDLHYKKQQISQLQERVEETELSLQGFINSDSENQNQILTERLTILEKDNELLKAKFTEKNLLLQERTTLLQQLEQKIVELSSQLIEERGRQNALLKEKREFEEKLLKEAEEVGTLKNALMEKQVLVKQTLQEMQNLEEKKSQLEEALRQSDRQKPPKKKNEENLPYAPSNTRQIEAMYIQLKTQFQEKCEILDATRRELFHAKEELMKRQKEIEEEAIYGQPINEKYLQQNLLKISKEFEQMQFLYRQEIDELTRLVQQLFKQMNG